MMSLRSRRDAFKMLLPKEFLCDEIIEKYTKILVKKNSFYTSPIDFLNETIQKVQVLGFGQATFQQQQTTHGAPMINPRRVEQNDFQYPNTEYSYRSPGSPVSLIDRTLNITFRHTLGYLNYFLLFENFWYQYTRDRDNHDLDYYFSVDIYNEKGSIYSRIVMSDPLIESMDMLDFDFTQPVAQSQTFNVTFKYQNFDFQFIDIEDNPKSSVLIEESKIL